LVSSASMIFHPSPASETSALSRIQLSRASAFAKEFLQKGPFFKAQFYDVLLLGHESSPCFKQQGCLIHEYDSTSRKRDTSRERHLPGVVDGKERPRCLCSPTSRHQNLGYRRGLGRRYPK